MEHKPVHIVSDVLQGKLCFGRRQADRAYNSIAVLLMGEDVLNPSAHPGLLAIRAGCDL